MEPGERGNHRRRQRQPMARPPAPHPLRDVTRRLHFAMKSKALLATFTLCALALAAFAGVEQTVNDLLPRLAAAKVEDRYSAQMELQQLAANAARPGAEADRAELAKVLAAKATDAAVPQPARVWIVRQIEYIGAAESVPALTTLLEGQDAELKECARRALEKNPAPAATESLRAALKQGGELNWKVGLIQSLGERGDAQSVSLIALSLAQPETCLAAASVLSKIVTEQAVNELWAAFDKNTVGAADAPVATANRLAVATRASAAPTVFLSKAAHNSLTACSVTILLKAEAAAKQVSGWARLRAMRLTDWASPWSPSD